MDDINRLPHRSGFKFTLPTMFLTVAVAAILLSVYRLGDPTFLLFIGFLVAGMSFLFVGTNRRSSTWITAAEVTLLLAGLCLLACLVPAVTR